MEKSDIWRNQDLHGNFESISQIFCVINTTNKVAVLFCVHRLYWKFSFSFLDHLHWHVCFLCHLYLNVLFLFFCITVSCVFCIAHTKTSVLFSSSFMLKLVFFHAETLFFSIFSFSLFLNGLWVASIDLNARES